MWLNEICDEIRYRTISKYVIDKNVIKQNMSWNLICDELEICDQNIWQFGAENWNMWQIRIPMVHRYIFTGILYLRYFAEGIFIETFHGFLE